MTAVSVVAEIATLRQQVAALEGENLEIRRRWDVSSREAKDIHAALRADLARAREAIEATREQLEANYRCDVVVDGVRESICGECGGPWLAADHALQEQYDRCPIAEMLAALAPAPEREGEIADLRARLAEAELMSAARAKEFYRVQAEAIALSDKLATAERERGEWEGVARSANAALAEWQSVRFEAEQANAALRAAIGRAMEHGKRTANGWLFYHCKDALALQPAPAPEREVEPRGCPTPGACSCVPLREAERRVIEALQTEHEHIGICDHCASCDGHRELWNKAEDALDALTAPRGETKDADGA